MSADQGKRFFDEFIDDYFVECEEHLGSARNLILELERSGASAPHAVLDELLRNFHSIKGLSAMVGVEEITQLSHHIEGYFRELKDPSAQISSYGISQVLAGINGIDEVLNARRKSEPPPDVSALLAVLQNASEEARAPVHTNTKKVATTDSPRAAERKWKVEFRSSPELAARGMTVSTLRDRLASLGQVANVSPRVLEDGGVAFEFTVISDALDSSFKSLLAEGVVCTPIGAAPDHLRQPVALTTLAAPGPAAGPGSVLRVDMNRLDDLMRIVGELVVSRFHLNETLRSANECLTPAGFRVLQDINASMEQQLRELRETVIRTRMVPIGQIFDRMRFVIRGLERETQKQVQVVVSGEDTELDKVIVEKMTDPLLHLVRNSVSHGIESAEERLASGKPAEGVIRLSASALGDSVLVEVEDDGRGLDIRKVTERARALGMLGNRDVGDSKFLLDVICAPGFTTRDEADLISGRGVGMEAVQSAVSELGGVMALDTSPGKGTRFTIQLPLTLTIMDSLLVSVGQHKFAVPQAAVREVLAVESSSVTVFENNDVIPYRGGVLPILSLNRLFGIKIKPRKRIHVLVIGVDSNAVGFGVDRILGQREIVVRGITDPMLKIPGVTGATETGDGKPILILDLHALIRTQRGRPAMENPS